MVPGTRVHPSTGDSHFSCGVCGVFSYPESLRGPMSCLSDLWVVCVSIKHSPAEEIHCSFAEPAKLWCQHIFLLWDITTGITNHLWLIFYSPLEHNCMHCMPCSFLLCSGRSVAVGFAGSFPHPSPSWSKAVGVFPKYCSAGFFRNGHTELRQVS